MFKGLSHIRFTHFTIYLKDADDTLVCSKVHGSPELSLTLREQAVLKVTVCVSVSALHRLISVIRLYLSLPYDHQLWVSVHRLATPETV